MSNAQRIVNLGQLAGDLGHHTIIFAMGVRLWGGVSWRLGRGVGWERAHVLEVSRTSGGASIYTKPIM